MAPWGRSSTRPSPSRRVYRSRRVPACGDARRILRGADPPAARAGPGPHGTTARARRHGARPERRGATARTGCGRRPPGTRRRRPGSTRRGSAARGGPDGPVGVTGLEPATSCSQSRRAANCATPRLRRTPSAPHPAAAPVPVRSVPRRGAPRPAGARSRPRCAHSRRLPHDAARARAPTGPTGRPGAGRRPPRRGSTGPGGTALPVPPRDAARAGSAGVTADSFIVYFVSIVYFVRRRSRGGAAHRVR